MNVKVAKLLANIPINVDAALASLIGASVKFDKDNLLELFVARDKDGAFFATVAYVGEATTQEVKEALDRGEMPKIFGTVEEKVDEAKAEEKVESV
jgi:hypothetical protein